MFEFLRTSPTPYHAAETVARRCAAAGFQPLDEGDRWRLEPGGAYYAIRDRSTFYAVRVGTAPIDLTGVRMVGAHTDSPALKVRMNGIQYQDGAYRLPVDVYGGPLVYTWLDRPLRLAGAVALRAADSTRPVVDRAAGATGLPAPGLLTRLFDFGTQCATIPSLAIHFNRTVNDGYQWNVKDHLPALWPAAVATVDDPADDSADDSVAAFLALIAERVGCAPEDILGTDLWLTDGSEPMLLGRESGWYQCGRIDNLAACASAIDALIASGPTQATAMVLLYDHEEIGSRTYQGADSALTSRLIDRVATAIAGAGGSTAAGVGQVDFDLVDRVRARSMLVSQDATHAVHPNYRDRHDPAYAPVLNGGPVVKESTTMRYTSTVTSAALFAECCARAGVPCRRMNTRPDLPSGSTIGPAATAHAGIAGVDVGVPILAMHSLRETAALGDQRMMQAALQQFFHSESVTAARDPAQ